MIIRTFLITTIMFACATAAVACSCAMSSGGACESYWSTPAVFSGRVVQIDDVKRGGDQLYYLSKKVRFAVIDPFRGVTGETIEVNTGSGGGDCGYKFEANESYLVYAWRSEDGVLSTGICSRTRPLTAAADDLAYIRGLADAAPGSTISGTVFKRGARREHDVNRERPTMPNIPISIESDKDKFETKTDAEGDFHIEGIPPGKYTVKPTVPPGYYNERLEQKVEVHDKGCAIAPFWLEVDTRLGGRLTDQAGHPVKDTLLDLVPVEQINDKTQDDRKYADIDESGRFTFRNIPDGKYFLGTRLGRSSSLDFAYPRYFYPGTTNIAKAAIIEIHEGIVLENYDLQLPPKLGTRTISGKVTVPEGVKLEKAYICFEEAPAGSCQSDGEIKPDGTFKFTRFSGVKYILRAYANANDRQFFSKPITIPETGNVKGLKVIIDSPTRD